MSLTIKAGTSYDAPWYVIDAASIDDERSQLLAFAGLTEESTLPDGRKVSEASLLQLAVAAGLLFQSAWKDGWTGEARAQSRSVAAKAEQGSAPAKPAEAKKKEEEAQADTPAILEDIAKAQSKAELKEIASQNQGAFKAHPELLQAMKDRSAQL